MAMNVPKVGFSRMMKEGTKRFQGVEEAVMRNIDACKELADTVKSAFGPNGMNKMVINHLEKLFVTNDAATIMQELEVQHPAAKIIVLACQMQQQQVGDGTNSVVILAASLLQHAEMLLKMGLSPSEIADGYDLACEKALEILPSLVVHSVEDLKDADKVAVALKTAIMSKQYGNEDFLAKLVAKACVQVSPRNVQSFNVDNIRICKILGSGVHNSTVKNGMVFKRGAEGEVKKALNAKIAVFTCPFDITQTETKGTVLINNAKELMDFSKGEEDEVEMHVKALFDAGISCVVAGGKFGDLYLHFLNKYNMMAVRLNSKFDVRRLCVSVGATPQTRISVPPVEHTGACDSVHLDEVGDTEVVIFEQKSDIGRIATVVIRGSSDNLMDDIERAIDDAVNTYKALAKDSRLVPGCGAVEIELARQVESVGEKCAGLSQYAIQKFALALESLPKQLADNMGCKAAHVLSKLYAEHQNGNKNFGFDNEVDGGGVRDVVEAGVLDLYILKWWALKLASNAATTILKIDQIIMAKQAGGPKPRQMGAQDADDD